MNTPGFTAEASLYRTNGRYRAGVAASGNGDPGTIDLVVPSGFNWLSRISVSVDANLLLPQHCEEIGKPCCRSDSGVKGPHCHNGLGCNVNSGLCEACGKPGQVCCDGHYTDFSGKSYTGVLWNTNERISSCDDGTRCDATLAPDGVSWLGTRRCQACGIKLGGPCCAPDNRYALGRCFRDATTNEPLACNDPWAGAGGTCIACGKQAGQPACHIPGEDPCVDTSHGDQNLASLTEENYICVSCGWPGMPTCDRGDPCRGNNSVPNKSWSQCVLAGGPNQPCMKNGKCGYQGLFCNSNKICEQCGEPGTLCCPPGSYPDNRTCNDPGECRLLPKMPPALGVEFRCFACGYANMPVCQTGDLCRDSSEPISGMCRPCGKEGQPCCRTYLSIRCYDGMRCEDNVCKKPSGGGGGQQPKRCNGQPYTINTLPRPVGIEGSDGCVAYENFASDGQAEAVQCARAKYGNAVVEDVNDFTWSVTCGGFCNMTTFYARDYAAAARCAYSIFPTCTILDIDCP